LLSNCWASAPACLVNLGRQAGMPALQMLNPPARCLKELRSPNRRLFNSAIWKSPLLVFCSADFLGQIDRRRLLELASAAAQLEHAGPMQSAVSINRFRPPIVIRAFNRFGSMLNGKVSRSIPPEELIDTAKRRSNLNDFGDGDFREALGRLLESCWRDARLNAIGTIALRSDVLRILRNRLLLQRDRSL